MRITVRQRVTDYGSASPPVRPVGQTCRTSSVCRRPCGLGMEFATHHRRASPFLHICASLASTQEIFCYLSHLLPTFRPTMWNGLRATPFGVSHSLIGSKMKPHSRFLYESDRDINGRLAPRIPAQPNSLNLLPAQMFVVQPLRATHRVSGYASGGT